MLEISEVSKKGVAFEEGFEKGDKIIAFDGHKAVDILDYLYYDSLNEFTIQVLAKGGEEVTVEIEKEDDETLGLSFLDDGLEIKTCYNDCIFCFVRQMPCGMRDSLYVKDDDYRQSFLHGNFVTLTNVTDEDVERIIRLKLSPLYVSVHALRGETRDKMLKNRFAHRITEFLDAFEKGGIKFNAQVVLVKDVNDGEELDFTVNGLYKYKNLLSAAVVPCGITKFRDGLYHIDDITPEYARSVIKQVDELNAKNGGHKFYLADEFYFKGGVDLPSYESYGEFLQVENGVGMSAKFIRDVEEIIKKYRENGKVLLEKGRYLSVSGTSVYRFMLSVIKKVEAACEGVSIKLLPVENRFFGSTVNCTGLLTGRDILNAVKESGIEFDTLLIPNPCLMQDEDKFLDDTTLDDLAKELNKKVVRARMDD
ncbi:MAG: DUF512 domain-containing protein [Candidatus Borkfalkiaceae bacterium]|nr:DUF512 domain-containing protein [Christensenellaceae bacterium]